MLVLSRKPKQQIVFPELGIEVEVLNCKGNQVRLGIKAPDSVRILRGELEEFANAFAGPHADADCRPEVHRCAASY